MTPEEKAVIEAALSIADSALRDSYLSNKLKEAILVLRASREPKPRWQRWVSLRNGNPCGNRIDGPAGAQVEVISGNPDTIARLLNEADK